MAYTTIDNPALFFNTVLYTGDLQDSDGTGHTQSITGVGFQPDWVWHKGRSGARTHMLVDRVRGVSSYNWLASSGSGAEVTTNTNGAISSIDSDGITVQNGNDSSSKSNNAGKNGETWVFWNWLAGGSAPAITYTVKVVSDSGNKYRFDDFGTSAVTLDLQEGGTYTFDQSDSSNAGHPLRFYTASDKSGGEYTTGVSTTGTAGSSGAKTVITVAASAPTLYYQCSNHAGMGGQANTNSTFGSSNFSGSIQSTVSAGSTQGFSVVSYTGSGTTSNTVGHGLSSIDLLIVKSRDEADSWFLKHKSLSSNHNLNLDQNVATTNVTSAYSEGGLSNLSGNTFGFLDGTSDANAVNESSEKHIAYCFNEVKGYSKFKSYTGNGNADGTFVYTGFKPAWILIKDTGSNQSWFLYDNKRDTINPNTKLLTVNNNSAEEDSASTGNTFDIDFVSNGFKIKTSYGGVNTSGNTYVYICFAESPFVNSNGIPTNAR